jgi:hypothetical protein
MVGGAYPSLLECLVHHKKRYSSSLGDTHPSLELPLFMFVKPPKVRSLDNHINFEDPIGIPLPTAHYTLEPDHDGVLNFSCRIDKTLANVGKQG